MRRLSPRLWFALLALGASGCSLLTDFDRAYPDPLDEDVGVDEAPGGECVDACSDILGCTVQLDRELSKSCEGLLFDQNLASFLGACVDTCADSGLVPKFEACDTRLFGVWEELYGDPFVRLCEPVAIAPCGDEGVCTGGRDNNFLYDCVEVTPPAGSDCSDRCESLPDAFWFCVGQGEARISRGANLEACGVFRRCFDITVDGRWP